VSGEAASVPVAPRLFTPDASARYLGLGSRYAIYRLVAAGDLPVVHLAGKLRIDVQDLDALIEIRKRISPSADGEGRPAMRGTPHAGLPVKLAALRPARHGDSPVTRASKPRPVSARVPRPSQKQSGAPPVAGSA